LDLVVETDAQFKDLYQLLVNALMMPFAVLDLPVKDDVSMADNVLMILVQNEDLVHKAVHAVNVICYKLHHQLAEVLV
jgi:hypothetical protein